MKILLNINSIETTGARFSCNAPILFTVTILGYSGATGAVTFKTQMPGER